MRRPVITMVTSDSHDLDEYILQIFEEQEEVFYFPVTTQSTARNFVKALHAKGLTYEAVYKEIGEFEHNFSAWRKGLGRIGIGNRIIERINKPLEDVLIADDNEDLQQILTRLKEKEAKELQRPNNNRVPPIEQPPSDESRLQRLRDNIQRQKTKQETAESRCTDTKVKVTDTKVKVTEEAERRRSAPSSPQLTRKSSDKTRSEPHSPQVAHRASQSPAEQRSPQLSRTSSGRIPGAEFDQVEPGVVDFRSVLKRRNQDDQTAPGGPGDRRSMPASLLLENAEKNRSKLSGSADRIHKIDNGERKSWLDERNERFKSRADSEPRGLQPRTGSEKKEVKDTVKQSTKTASTTAGSVKQSKVDTKPAKEKINTEKASADLVDFNEEPLPPHATRTAPLAAEDTDSTTDSDTTSSSSLEESSPENGEQSKESDEQSKESDDNNESDEESGDSESTKDMSDSQDENADTNKVQSKENGDDTRDTSDDDINDTNYETCSSLNETREDNETQDETGESDDEIGQNYDSDWDEECDDLTTAGRHVLQQILQYKTSQSELDGSGHVYVFSDSPNGSPAPRVKVGASRFPEKRLEQALSFNINMRMVTSHRVSLRKRVVEKISDLLEMYEIEGQEGWYQGPTDDMLNIVKTTAARYPVNTSEC